MDTRITLEDPNDYLEFRRGPGGTIEIVDIVVNSERGVGKGRTLINNLISWCSRSKVFYAFTRKSNVIAAQFYKALGFVQVAQITGFYEDPDDKVATALMFLKRIERN